MQNESFEQLSYAAHEKMYKESVEKFDSLKRIEDKESIDYWRHDRMYKLLTPMLFTDSKWLTVGDGIGTDANWLIGNKKNVVATDIADALLKHSNARGFIGEYQKQNAERMTFKDNQFDYVLCKESYHHFPRPYLALYEMLRVASNAVIMIEPIDIGVQMPYMLWLKNILDRIDLNYINKIWKNRASFEIVGNYVYKVSEREIEKVAMGMNMPAIAFKGINDYFSGELDFSQPRTNTKMFDKVKAKIARRDLLCRLGFIPYQLMSCVIFKKIPTPEVKLELEKNGYKYIELPPNPYLGNA